jgi:PAS domain S-box-containing protein
MDNSPIINAFKKMQVPLMIIGAEGEILHCNNSTHRLFGYDSNDLIGQNVTDILPTTSVAKLNAHIKPPAIDASINGLIGRSRRGDTISLMVQVTAWNDDEHGLQHALILKNTTEDMSGDSLAERELARASNALKGAQIGVFEYDAVTDTVIVSDIWRDLLELDPSDTTDAQVEWQKRLHPEDREAAVEPTRICLEGISERASCEYRLRTKDGTHWRWIRASTTVDLKDKDGKVIRIVGAMADITEQKEAENDLRRSVAQFRSAFDNATVGKAIIGIDGSFLDANTALCEFLGCPEEELLKTNFQALTHPDDLDADLYKLDLLKAGSIPAYQIEKRYIRADGAIVWGLLSVGMVKDAEGYPDHFISQIADVTEQNQLHEMRSEFVTTVSHELRTPLTSVLGALSLLSSFDEEPFSDDVQRLIYIAQQNGKRLHALVNDILDFEKFSARQNLLVLSKHRIVGLLEEAVLANMVTAQKFGVHYDIDFQESAVTGYVDTIRFQQVMTNLLTNAAKFADKGSAIQISVKSHPKEVQITITNQGDGIPDTFKDQIFKPFSQAESSATRSRGGTGLGLNISKQIVEQTGGTIGFDSTQDGKTTFWFTVPADKPN